MKVPLRVAAAAALILLSGVLHAQVAPIGVEDQQALLRSPDPRLAANKRLVFDMFRIIIQAGHADEAPRYFTESYVQHNPNVPSGRDALMKFMRESRPVRPVQPSITFPVVAIIAEGDLVTVATVSYAKDPRDPGRKYASTHFDLYRIEHGRIAEHWDNLPKDAALVHVDPNAINRP
jgi:predicted SnoaL-like aldol condensation-catalyzing enzyme